MNDVFGKRLVEAESDSQAEFGILSIEGADFKLLYMQVNIKK